MSLNTKVYPLVKYGIHKESNRTQKSSSWANRLKYYIIQIHILNIEWSTCPHFCEVFAPYHIYTHLCKMGIIINNMQAILESKDLAGKSMTRSANISSGGFLEDRLQWNKGLVQSTSIHPIIKIWQVRPWQDLQTSHQVDLKRTDCNGIKGYSSWHPYTL